MDVSSQSITDEQMTELINLVKTVHGFDFSDYTKASLKRRLTRVMLIKKLKIFKRFKIENGNVIWEKDWEMIFSCMIYTKVN